MKKTSKWTYFTYRGCSSCGTNGVDVVFRLRDGEIESKCGCGHEDSHEPMKLAPAESHNSEPQPKPNNYFDPDEALDCIQVEAEYIEKNAVEGGMSGTVEILAQVAVLRAYIAGMER